LYKSIIFLHSKAVKHAESSSKFPCASRPGRHRSRWSGKPWTRQDI
jgi:hypothetical protein